MSAIHDISRFQMDLSLKQERPVLFISYPRTTSNLLVRILNLDNQPNIITGPYQSGYHFLPIFIHQNQNDIVDVPDSTYTEEQRSSLRRMSQECFEKLEETRQRGEEENKLFFTKEHIIFLLDSVLLEKHLAKTSDPLTEEAFVPLDKVGSSRSFLNDTILSDDYLLLWQPLFLIRHPLKTFPSILRTQTASPNPEKQYANYSLYHFIRNLYDFYSKHLTKKSSTPCNPSTGSRNQPSSDELSWPIIIDADDYIKHPNLVKRLAVAIGLDVSKLQFSWAAAPSEKPSDEMLKTLLSSSGVEEDKLARGLTMEAERPKWVEEFGEESADRLERQVRDALPDYEYLVSKRVLP